MFLTDLSMVEGLGLSVLGLAIVFLVLIVLAVLVKIMAAVVNKFSAKAPEAKPAAAAAAAPAAPVSAEKAPGAAGELKLYDVPDKTAAMLMAIVANKMGKPLNELRFKSIKEVK